MPSIMKNQMRKHTRMHAHASISKEIQMGDAMSLSGRILGTFLVALNLN
jgi:hypothetical protein